LSPRQDSASGTVASDFFRKLNEDALANLDAWVPHLGLQRRPKREPDGGYRAIAEWRPSSSGRALGRRAPNLSFDRKGIVDFGDGGRAYTALNVVIEARQLDRDDAVKWLGEALGYDFAPTIVLKQSKPKAAPPDDGFISARALVQKQFEPLRWVVPDLLPEGLTILASKSKVGKSWLMLLLGLRIGGGEPFFDRQCEPGEVLYLALEDSERRVKDRLQRMVPFAAKDGGRRMPDRLKVKTTWKRIDQGGLDDLEAWIGQQENARLVIIDVWRRVAPPHKAGVNAYNQDYDHLGPLQQLAMRRRLAIVLVMHLKKAPSDGSDPFDEVLGSTGQVGVADTTFILKKTADGASLYGRGRDVEEFELSLRFNRDICQWESLGDADQLRKAKETNAIVKALQEAGRPMTRAEIIAETGLAPNTADVNLTRLVTSGKIERVGRGVFKAVEA